MSLDDHTKELVERVLHRLKGDDDDNVAGVPARKNRQSTLSDPAPPKHDLIQINDHADPNK